MISILNVQDEIPGFLDSKAQSLSCVFFFSIITANFLSLEKVGEGNGEDMSSIFPNHIQML